MLPTGIVPMIAAQKDKCTQAPRLPSTAAPVCRQRTAALFVHTITDFAILLFVSHPILFSRARRSIRPQRPGISAIISFAPFSAIKYHPCQSTKRKDFRHPFAPPSVCLAGPDSLAAADGREQTSFMTAGAERIFEKSKKGCRELNN